MSAPMTRAESEACGTCKSLALHGQPVEHEECAARAVLLLAPDHPAYEDLVDLSEEERKALPARFHTPHFDDLGQPNMWLCRVCWGDGWVSQWPCGPALEQGAIVFTSDRAAEDITAEVVRLRARVAELEAARTTAAADRDKQIIAWLEKKAREEGTSNKDSRVRATATYRLADKLSRGAVRPACPPVSPEDPHDSPLHHSYALGRDLPEVTPDPSRDESVAKLRALLARQTGGAL